MTFKTGDRVRAVKEHDGNSKIVGVSGTILEYSRGTIKIEFDKDISGHDCNGLGKHRYCWNISPDCLEYETILNWKERIGDLK